MKGSGKVYVMEGEDGLVKVGYSCQVDARARQIGNVVSIAYVTKEKQEAERIERSAHRLLRLAGKRVRGEWFSATVAEAIDAIERAERIAEGLELALDARPLSKPKPVEKTPFRLSYETLAELQRLADADRRSLTNYIEIVLEDHVKTKGKRK